MSLTLNDHERFEHVRKVNEIRTDFINNYELKVKERNKAVIEFRSKWV